MTFNVGQSGNPKGRPVGVVSKRIQLSKLLEPSAEKLIAKVVSMALEGNIDALRLCIERLIPRAKDEAIKVENLRGSLAEQGREILKQVGVGVLKPTEGKLLIEAILSQCRLIETSELIARVELLEEKVSAKIDQSSK